MQVTQRKLIPLTNWPVYHDWPSLAGLRALVFNEHKNGFDKVIRRSGKRILIDETAFFEWVDAQNQNNPA